VIGRARGDGYDHFFHSYLVAFVFCLSITLGGIFMVTAHHLSGAIWSVPVRRLAESLAANAPILGLLSLVIVVPTVLGHPVLYQWADAEVRHTDHLVHMKAAYLNPTFFAVRMVIYFGIWIAAGRFLLGRSTEQDRTGAATLTHQMVRVSAPALILLALSLTFASFDLLKSLDAEWYSTMFGVYYFAGCGVAVYATLSLLVGIFDGAGRMGGLVNAELRHDLGKMLFGFVFFWGYIAFAQFMLIWYANLPEETMYFFDRKEGAWFGYSLAMIAVHFAIPFVGLISYGAKRNRHILAFWAVWMLVAHYLDHYWIVMPSRGGGEIPFDILDITCLLGVGGLYVAGFLRLANKNSLVALRDPRRELQTALQSA
ncbi:MAG: hypothetical protein KC466_13780, partial [Myxococcales bacterium]|nr:hypothetical protein [Myxococcales bacterium]